MMNIKEVPLKGCLIMEPKVHGDNRGFFYESFNQKKFDEMVGSNSYRFVQDNHSRSSEGVLRGLHYQIKQPQGKLVRVIRGEIFDVAVDIRRSSPTFGKWYGLVLSETNRLQFWVPPGFAHGFLAMSKDVEVLYKTTDFYAPEYERTILWNDSRLNIDWQYEGELSLSEKDKKGVSFHDAEVFS